MATPIVIPAQNLHELALQCAQDINDHAEKIFAVACGGTAWANLNENATEAAIFRAIEDMAATTASARSLREYIDQLAAIAGSKLATEGVSHG